MNDFACIAPGVNLSKFINLYGCEIGDGMKMGIFLEVQKNARIARRRKISSHTFIGEGLTKGRLSHLHQSFQAF